VGSGTGRRNVAAERLTWAPGEREISALAVMERRLVEARKGSLEVSGAVADRTGWGRSAMTVWRGVEKALPPGMSEGSAKLWKETESKGEALVKIQARELNKMY
jgi:hypothetical protein